MPRTRAQVQADASKKESSSKHKDQKEPGAKPKTTAKEVAKSRKLAKSATGKHSHEEDQSDHKNDGRSKPTKKLKPSEALEDKSVHPSNAKVAALLSKYGATPLQQTQLPDPSRPLPETLLALVFNAMLTSARISHQIAARSVSCLIDAKYYDIDTLKNSSWQERTEVLTKGGYTHYREKTATMLGELADLVLDKYGKWSVTSLGSQS
jgi:hypothetical protein